MASDKQIAANRRNAQNSTGPRTKEGKSRSRRNAFKHGLTSETVLNGLEDAKEYKTFEKAVLSDFAPATTIEQTLVLRLASLLWRLKRAAAIQTGILQTQSMIIETSPQSDHSDNGPPPSDPIAIFRKLLAAPHQTISVHNADPSRPANAAHTNTISRPLEIAQAFFHLTELSYCSFELALRYEASLSRQLVQTTVCIAQVRQLAKLSYLLNSNTLRGRQRSN